MKKIYCLKGLPASGKSTWAKELIDKEPEKWKRINKDDLRAMLDNNKWSKKNEQCILETRDLLIKEFMKKGYGIIIDDTNLHEKHEKQIRKIIDEWNNDILKKEENCCDGSGKICEIASCAETRYRKCLGCKNCKEKYELEIKFFDISLSEAIDRDNKRTIGHVGQKVIRGMYDQFIAPLKNTANKLEQDPSLPHCVICDIDGTTAINVSRNIFDESKVIEDKPNESVVKLVQRLHRDSGGVGTYIIFFSGRHEKCRKDTLKWLSENVFSGPFLSEEEFLLPEEITLYMRKDGDDRKDSIIKKELFDEYIRGKLFVDFILDDRDQVVKMWRELGLTCLQVQDGSF